MRAVITGSAGFIGNRLARELLNHEYEVILIARNAEKLSPEIREHPSVSVIEKDICDMEARDFRNQDGIDSFYHLAWNGVQPEKKNDIRVQLANIPMSLHALETANQVGCGRFIAAGSVAEYAMEDGVMDLSAKARPDDFYGAGKAAARHFLTVKARHLRQPLIWTIIPSTFGEDRLDNNIITYTILSLLNGAETRYGSLTQMWDFLYVSETARALRLIGERGQSGMTYGIGSGIYRPLRDYVETIRDIIDPSLELGIGKLPSVTGQNGSSCVDIYDLIRDTGFYPQVSFEEGIRKTVDGFRKQNRIRL